MRRGAADADAEAENLRPRSERIISDQCGERRSEKSGQVIAAQAAAAAAASSSFREVHALKHSSIRLD
jgi:hypothetical protein